MKSRNLLLLATCALLPLVCGSVIQAAGAAQMLRYSPGAPQLNYLRIQPVAEIPEPASEPLNGRITYDENRTSRVSSPVAGRVVKIDAQPGDQIKAGQALLWLDSPDLGSALADQRKADADLHLKNLAYQRAKTLFDGEVLAKKDLESADADLRQSQAEASRARARMHNLTAGNVTGQDGRFALRAPVAGVVAERQANPGTEVRPDNPVPLYVITDPSHLWASIDLPERDLGKVHVRQAVSVEVDAYPGKRFSGKVASIGTALDPVSRRVQVRCTLDNPEGALKPEMYARITPLAENGHNALQVPNTALITEGLYSFVFVETAPGALEKRRVALAGQGREQSVVSAGLKAGERVVTTGALLLNSELAGSGK